MFEGYPIYDADAHVMLCPQMWEDLPGPYRTRRPRPVRIDDSADGGRWHTGWLIEGRIEPHSYGPGTQGANTPQHVLEAYGAPKEFVGSHDLSDPTARLRDLDTLGIDVQCMFPSTLYAKMTTDPGFEAALFRAYNRYMSRQSQTDPKRLKWAGLLPLADGAQGCEAVQEMAKLGAAAAVVYGTVGERMLSDPGFTRVWDALAATGMPLCVHMGMSYPPFVELCRSRLDAHAIAMSVPALLAFVAVVGHGLLDQYPNLKVAFLEFGGEWLFYMVGRIEHYLPSYRRDPVTQRLPEMDVRDYFRDGRIFLAAEAEDKFMVEELALLGDGQMLYSSDYPHGEGRENAAQELWERRDVSAEQKGRIFYDNAVRLFGEP